MCCEWQTEPMKHVGKETAYSDWMEQMRPDHLRQKLPVIILNSDKAFPVFVGEIELPYWRPVYVYLKGDAAADIAQNARKCLDEWNGCWPSILLDYDSLNKLRKLSVPQAGDQIPEGDRFMFVYTLEWFPFPMPGELIELRTGPYIPGVSLGTCAGAAGDMPHVHTAGRDDPPVDSSVVVTAVIDADIGIANARFRNPDGTTRIRQFWRQHQGTTRGLSDLVTGQGFDAADINQMLSDSRSDEALFYHLLRSGAYGTKRWLGVDGSSGRRAFLKDGDGTDSPSWEHELAARLIHVLEVRKKVKTSACPFKFHPISSESWRKDHEPGDGTTNIVSYIKSLIGRAGTPDGETVAHLAEYLVMQPGKPDLDETSRIEWELLLRGANYDSPRDARRVGFRAGHGTHIMDLAAGWPAEEAPENRPIVAVELPDYVIEDMSGARLELFVLMAMHRILHWVDDWHGTRVPVVVNISLGNAAGPRNGLGFLEAQLERLARRRNDAGVATKVVIAAGNGYRGRLAADFAIDGPGAATEEVLWRVPPGDHSPSYLEIRADDVRNLSLTIATPDGTKKEIDLLNGAKLICDGRMVGRVYRSDDGNGEVLTLALAATSELDSPYRQAPAGTYRLVFGNKGDRRMSVNLGIQRDETLSGYPTYGKQSYLDHPSLRGRDALTRNMDAPDPYHPGQRPISRLHTLSSYATIEGENFFVIGGAIADQIDDPEIRSEGRAAAYSGAGPTLGASRDGPDLGAVSEDGPGSPGRLAAGYFSGSCVAYSGTSTATARATRAIVDALSSLGPGDTGIKKGILENRHVLGTPLPISPDSRLGYGILTDKALPGRVSRRRYLCP
ncbi:hypothetical protein KNW02_02650 [Paracoccus sp. XHP0099]|uniref:Peptidase S8/S53 domain-containing protein n=1 Tax=Paracoccus marinaquae TaxID=2841926 RepID=A0ABS6AI21_9RHOB|nr:hypothetical protein [Paracoccus marinaquae]